MLSKERHQTATAPVSYKTAYNLGSEVADEKRVDGRAAKRALARWMNLHPTNVTQKVQLNRPGSVGDHQLK